MARKRTAVHERRQALVEAAMRVMSRDGIAAATTRAICAEAGMPNGFFHYCFTSKDELMLEVVDLMEKRWHTFAQSIKETRGSLRDVLTMAFMGYLDDLKSDPGFHQLGFELTLHELRESESFDVPRHQYTQYADIQGQALVSAAEVACARWRVPSRLLSDYAAVVFNGVTLEWLSLRDDQRAMKHLELLTEFILNFALEPEAGAGGAPSVEGSSSDEGERSELQ